jgi:hypothetical protein
LQKTVVSVTINNKTIHLMDIFNSAQYELIPYTTYDNINIGFPNVIRMFMLIDMWFLRILYSMSLINDNTLKYSINNIFKNLEKVEDIDDTKFSRELYLGIYVDLMRYKKKISVDNVFYPYNPEQHRYQKGNYRVIT